MSAGTGTTSPLRLGLRANAAQFTLLVTINALVGGMVGQQQTVLPLLAETEFGLTGYTFIFSYVPAFGITKAAVNWIAGTFSDRYGRKPVLLAGWLFAVPVPVMLIVAPSWGWVVAANVLLGLSQGLTWSTTVVMKIDLVGPQRRGLAMGLNEAAGYGAVAVTSLLAGYLAEQHGLRPAPFLLGLFYVALALRLSGVLVHETRGHAQLAAGVHTPAPTAATTTCTPASPTGRSSRRPASPSPPSPRPARPGWSTTSTSASPGACSPCCSPPPTCASGRSGCCSPSTRGYGAGASSSPGRCRTASAVSA